MPKSQHTELFNLIEYDGPHVSIPVLDRVFPQGLEAHDPKHFRNVRAAYEEWDDDKDNPAIHRAWVTFVLHESLGYSDDILLEGPAIPPGVEARVAEHGETLRPDLVLVNPAGREQAGKPRMLIRILPPDQDLSKPEHGSRWKASPDTRMMMLCKAANVPLGLLTNGEQWMLVYAPPDETTGYTSWYAHLWLEEPLTFRAWRSLLGVRRFFGVAESDTLESLLTESARNQQEVTDQLGLQVREAVELFVETLDRIDMENGRKTLADVAPEELYEASLTVMMRLVFLFCAEERDLLLLGDPVYDQFYAVSTLSAQLREVADQHGEEILERRYDAWSRLLATVRAVYGGVQHENLRLTAYGGSLFDPDRFPFLEGRAKGTSWRDAAGRPLPVDNRTVLHLMEALQFLQLGGERQRLSFRALGIEQIGHVYEGLLDHTVWRVPEGETVLSLTGAKGNEPEVALTELETQRAKGEKAFITYLKDLTGRSEKAIENSLSPNTTSGKKNKNRKKAEAADLFSTPQASLATPQASPALRVACGNDENVLNRVLPFAGLIREDSFGHLVVINAGSFYVTQGSERRKTGTHYTPRSLTEPIVQYTLEPLVYEGPAEGWDREQWKLKSATEILALKVCDMAMGSGAFLVQTVRYLGERLVEAWENAENLLGARDEGLGTGSGGVGAVKGDGGSVAGEEKEIAQGGGEGGRGEGKSAFEIASRNVFARPSSRKIAEKLAILNIPTPPVTDLALPEKGASNVRSELPGTGGVASSDDIGRSLLQNNPTIPEGGDVRADQPDPARGSVGSREYRRGPGEELHQGIPPSSQHCPRVIDGIGDPSHVEPACGTAGRNDIEGSSSADGTRQPDAQRFEKSPSSQIEGKLIVSPPATHHAPLSTLHPPQITPEGLPSSGAPGESLVPADPDERMLYARRIVCDRCIYGVDINPLAVEMAKLSLWLVTMGKGRAFTFLNHALKCGDSLLGLWDVEQIYKFHLDTAVPAQASLWGDHVRGIFEYAMAKRRELESFSVIDVRDAEDKARLLAEADRAMEVVRILCDLLIAGAISTADGNSQRRGKMLPNAFDQYRDRIFDRLTEANSRKEIDSALEAVHSLIPEGQALLNSGNPNPENFRNPFHWPLEFPEIFHSPHPTSLAPHPAPPAPPSGFSAFVGNPPFQGGQRITGAVGTDFRNYCVDAIAQGQRGSADLCAYFFLRAGQLLRGEGRVTGECSGSPSPATRHPSPITLSPGMFGLLATNTIAQGDTREVGLDQLVKDGFNIPRAIASRKWPGVANLEVAHVWMRKGPWHGGYVLEDKPVTGITPFLVIPGKITGTPYRLAANANKSFQGSIVLGMGFIMTPEEAQALIDREPKNKDVLYPYLNGEDLNSRWDQSPSRWIINFHDWPLDRSAPGSWDRADDAQRKKFLQSGRVPADYPDPVAADYPDCLAIVEETVKPERANNNRKCYRDRWWHYAEKRPDLCATIAEMERVLIRARVANINSIAFVPRGTVASEATVVFASPDYDFFVILQAAPHTVWLTEQASSMRTDVRYTPSDCLETFPFPDCCGHLDNIGARYYAHRQSIMKDRQEGLTRTYNRLFNSQEKAEDIQRLRELHAEMDRAVADAYGWTDLDLGHDFHETKQGIRFTVSEPARREILDRLLALNHQRYAEEVAQGLHDKGAKSKRKKDGTGQGELF